MTRWRGYGVCWLDVGSPVNSEFEDEDGRALVHVVTGEVQVQVTVMAPTSHIKSMMLSRFQGPTCV